MKKLEILLIVIIASTFLSSISYAETVNNKEIELFTVIQNMGYSRAYVDISDDEVIIKISIENNDFIGDISTLFINAIIYANVDNYVLEIFDNDKRLFKIVANSDLLNNLALGSITEDVFLENIFYEDTRSIEEKIKTDIELLDSIVYGLKLTNDECQVSILYNNDINTLVSDLPNMHLIISEKAPWVEKVFIKVENHSNNEYLQFELDTHNVIKLLNNEIDYEEYYNLAKISVEKIKSLKNPPKTIGSWFSRINKVNVVDLLIVVIILGLSMYGYIKGFFSIIFRFMSYLVPLLGARFLAPKAVQLLSSSTPIISKIDGFVINKLAPLGIDVNMLNNELPSINQILNQNDSVRQVMSQNPMLSSALEAQSSLFANNNNLLDMLSNFIIYIVFVILIFIVLKIILSYIIKAMNHSKKNIKNNIINKTLGILFGMLTGVIICSLVVFIVMSTALLGSNSSITDLINNSFIAEKLLGLINIIL